MTDEALSKSCGPVVWIRPGHAGYLGPELGVDMHSGSVPVLTVGLDGPFVLETATHGAMTTRSAYAPARAVHRVNTLGRPILLLFVDPAWSPSAAIEAQMADTAGPYRLDHCRERELVEQCNQPELDPSRIVALAAAGPVPVPDPRLERVAAAIRRHPDRTFRAEPIASDLDLSTSHFLRLFVQQYGTTFRRYQQWCRIIHAMSNVAAGHDLTRSATDAGFATPSHFSETFHRMFGMSANATLRTGIRFDLEPVP
ncbi:helix-turn-helix domain-containing protein [Nocardia sp. NPDC058640]|uniref:helix-turn-helix domain-containing protein n=1 Tax=Nocardia sp. NPDC058640 TaxID=3346571 RepID=UPI0036565A07